MPNLADLMVALDRQSSGVRKATLNSKPPSERAPSAESDDLVAWMILGKPAIRDQMSLVLGARVSSAVRILAGGERPHLVCFCGGELDTVHQSSDGIC